MSYQKLKPLCIRAAVCLLLSLSLPSLLATVNIVWHIAPQLYAGACVSLYLFFEISLFLFQRKRYFTYILSLGLIYLAFSNLAGILAYLELNSPYDHLLRMQKLRVNYVLNTMLRVVVGSSIIYHLFALRRERQLMAEAKLKAELAMLKSQITPHFFFNSLNSIYSLTLAKSDKAPEAIITLSDMMRYVLTDAKQDWISIEQEIAYLSRYVELQQLRLPRKTTLDYQVEVEGQYQIPPMLLVTFFENAFKYGSSAQKEATIHIHLSIENHTLRLSTHNAIVTEKKPENSTGNGIAGARRRLELIYPHRHELKCSEKHGYYQVELHIQLV